MMARCNVRTLLVLFLLAVTGTVLLSGSMAVASENSASTGVVTVTIPSGSFEIKSTDKGHEVVMDGFGRMPTPGGPALPAKIFSIAVPPGAVVNGVICEPGGSQVLVGNYHIAPVGLPRIASGDEDPAIFARNKAEYDATYAAIYGSNNAYPALSGQFERPAGYRKYNLADVNVFPMSYQPKTGRLIYHSEITVSVHYSLPDTMPSHQVMVDNLACTESLADQIIVNYDQAASWYPNTQSNGEGLYEFVIITLDSLTSAVQPLVDWEVLKGRTVNVTTTSWIDTNYTGYDLAEKMRNFLRDKYPSSAWGITDVCLIGHYDDVPMRRCEQDVGYGKPETDYYYAELSLPDNQSWDANQNHRWGEDIGDPIDFTAEVNVGRIPWSDTTTVQHICTKSVAYENNGDPSFKQNILLLGAFFWSDTDNAVLMEYKTNTSHHPWMANWTRTRMYEQGYSAYPMDYALNNGNVRSVWSAGKYGFVNWGGHGSPTSCHVAYSSPSTFVSNSDCPYLNDDYPAIIFADACSNSDTDNLNLGQAMLKQGAVGFLGATKVAYGMPAWNDPYDGSSQSMDYFFTTCCTSGDYTQGAAQQYALREMYTNNLWYYDKYETFEWGALWGNPDLEMGTKPALTMIPQNLPGNIMPPGPATVIEIEILDGQELYMQGTGKLHYRFDPAAQYTEVALTSLGGDLYSATMPNTVPGDEPEFYFSAQGNGGTTIYAPFNAPGTVYSFDVCLVDVVMTDDFETNQGWTVQSDPSLSTGEWERGNPGKTDAQPGDDHSPNGVNCYVTGRLGGSIGDYDVDGGPTYLTSPVIDLSAGDAVMNFYLWFYHSTNGTQQPLEIDMSDDGGNSWTRVKNVNHDAQWNLHSYKVSDYVSPTSQVQVRFKANDNPNDSVVEALVDDFSIERYNYSPSIWAAAYSVSASAGFVVDIYLDAGTSYAGREYIVGGSMSGSSPGYTLPGGLVLPINYDFFTRHILGHMNGPIYQNFRAFLDNDGKGTAILDSQGAINPVYVGNNLTFAFTLYGAFDYVSNPIAVEIEP